jgi:hypothetical protein
MKRSEYSKGIRCKRIGVQEGGNRQHEDGMVGTRGASEAHLKLCILLCAQSPRCTLELELPLQVPCTQCGTAHRATVVNSPMHPAQV